MVAQAAQSRTFGPTLQLHTQIGPILLGTDPRVRRNQGWRLPLSITGCVHPPSTILRVSLPCVCFSRDPVPGPLQWKVAGSGCHVVFHFGHWARGRIHPSKQTPRFHPENSATSGRQADTLSWASQLEQRGRWLWLALICSQVPRVGVLESGGAHATDPRVETNLRHSEARGWAFQVT